MYEYMICPSSISGLFFLSIATASFIDTFVVFFCVSKFCFPLAFVLSHLTFFHLLQILSTQKEMQKQMSTVVSAPVTKEGRRLEAALGRSIEKASKANTDALWARIQEEITKLDKSLRDRMLQIPGHITNIVNKDLPAVVERTLKKELAAVGTSVARTITPAIEKTISSAITESFQVRPLNV